MAVLLSKVTDLRRQPITIKEEQQAERDAEAAIRVNPPRALPLADQAFVLRLREWFAIVRPATGAGLCDIRSKDTARNCLIQAYEASKNDSSHQSVTPKTFQDSFAMHLVQQ